MTASSSRAENAAPAESLRAAKPGWTSRLFGIEPALLQACDAEQQDGEWGRGESFRFLYRSRRGKNFLLTTSRDWRVVTDDEARRLFGQLPVKLVDELAAPAEREPTAARDEEEDPRGYLVVRNEAWAFSVWLDDKEIPQGWRSIGVAGTKRECLDYIEQHCVFGAPNPGIP